MIATVDQVQIETRKSSRARRISLTVYPGGRAVLTLPPRASRWAVELFLRQQREWLKKQLARRREKADGILLPAGRQDYLRHKERCRLFVVTCLRQHNRLYCQPFGRVAVKNLYGNWGSCSVKRNLNFNYKLIHLPPRLAEYIVVHELCHLKEMNHSARFWAEVARAVPDWRERRRELRKYQM